jgi:hypothetical protein
LANAFGVSAIAPSTEVVPSVPVIALEIDPEVPAILPAPMAAIAHAVPALDSKETSQAVSTIFGVLDESTKNVLFNFLAPIVQPIVQQSTFELRKRAMFRRQESDWDTHFEALSPDLQEKLRIFANELTYVEAVDSAGESDIDSWLETAISSLQDSFASSLPRRRWSF